MPRPGGRKVAEKPKNLFGSLKRLFKNLSDWNILLCFALFLAMISAILSLIAPNKLSSFADEIQKGLVPKTDKFEVISNEIGNNFSNINFEEKFGLILSSKDISEGDKAKAQEVIGKMPNVKKEDEKTALFLSLPPSVLRVLLSDITVDNVKISVSDQLKMFSIMSEMGNEKSTKTALKALDKLPKSVYSIVKPTIDTSKVRSIVIFMAVIYLLSAIFSYIQAYSMTTISNGFAKKLRTNISEKINRLPLRYFDTHEAGDILSRVTNDVDTISQNLNNSLSSLVSSLTLFLGSILMMFITSWVMAVTAILSTVIGFAFMFLILGKSQKYFIENQRVLGEVNGYIEEVYSGHNVVKVYNGSEQAIKDFEVLNKKLYKAKRNSIFLSGLMQPIMGFVGNLGYVAVCIVGALLTMNGYITFGVIVAFMIYIRLFTNPLSQIAQAMTNLQSTAAASERVFEFMDEEEMKNESSLKKSVSNNKIKGNIEFKNVRFGYDNNRTIINNFSAVAHHGQKIAIVGPTGAGKTTIVNLLMKFYDINDGEIIIDGVSTKKLSRAAVHDLFVMVLQDTWLFEGTIRDNIKFNSKNVTDEDIWNVCKTVGIDHFIKTLPGGLDAEVKNDDSISSGQKQLLTIARGMISNSPFLILDEATSNVDTRTEELVQKAMDKLSEGRTSFIIAHRLSTIKNADLILVMKDGNIIEQGNHEELLNKNGFYSELYNSQFETVE